MSDLAELFFVIGCVVFSIVFLVVILGRNRRQQLALQRAFLDESVEPLSAEPSADAAPPASTASEAMDPSRSRPYRATPAPSNADEELEALAARGRRREEAALHVRDEQIESVRLARLCDAMRLLPSARGGPAPIPDETSFPRPQELAADQYVRRPAPDDVDAAARKAAAVSTWLASLPFALDRYFAILAEAPEAIFYLEIDVTLVDPYRTPGIDTLRGLLHLHDRDASVASPVGGPIMIASSKEAVSLPGDFPYTVRRIAPYVRSLVDHALLPLHRSHPIARVVLRRV